MFRKKLYYSVLIPAVLLALRPVWAAEIHVSTWDELKSAVENGVDGAGAGGTVYLDKNIDVPAASVIFDAVPGIVIDGQGNTIFKNSNGYFLNFYSDDRTDLQIKNVVFENVVIANAGMLGNINADFINNGTTSSRLSSGGAIGNSGIIGDIIGDFSGNNIQNKYKAYGGAIDNSYGIIGDITGNFTNNYAQSDGRTAQGGAIYNGNGGTIGDITADFTNNHVQSDGDATGGAIYNLEDMALTNSSFYDNYAQSDSGTAHGGAIYNTGNMIITADNGVSEFSGNKIIHNDADGNKVEDSEAIYNVENLTLNAVNNGIIRFDDKINGVYFDMEEELSQGGMTLFRTMPADIIFMTGKIWRDICFGRRAAMW